MNTTQTQKGNDSPLTVDDIMWNSGMVAQRISYAQKALTEDELPIIFDGKAVKGWKQLPLQIRRKIEGTVIEN